MAAGSSRGRSAVVAVALLALFGAAVAYVWLQYGVNRALTTAVALVAIFALVWLALTVVSLISVWRSKRKRSTIADGPLTNTQRPVARRPPILTERSDPHSPDSDEPPTPGRRRKNS